MWWFICKISPNYYFSYSHTYLQYDFTTFRSRHGLHLPNVGALVTELDRLNSRYVMACEIWPQKPCMIPCVLLELYPDTMWTKHAWVTFLDDERHLNWSPPLNLNNSQPISKDELRVTKDPWQNPADKRTIQLHPAYITYLQNYELNQLSGGCQANRLCSSILCSINWGKE